jgi:hypothetical protein
LKQSYKGSCHCGHVKFEVRLVLDHLRVCDCSICHKRGALNYRVEDADLDILTPLENMSLYQWHTNTAKDYFCPNCGILPFRRPRTATHLWTVNLRCLDDVDISNIPIQPVFGSKLD